MRTSVCFTQQVTPLLFSTSVCHQVVAEYHNRKAEIGRLEKDLDKKQSVLKKHTQDIEVIRKNWLPPLQHLISKINNNFRYMPTLGDTVVIIIHLAATIIVLIIVGVTFRKESH